MFIAELFLYIDYLKELLQRRPRQEQTAKEKKSLSDFYRNLRTGIKYYRQLSLAWAALADEFGQGLDFAGLELDSLNYQYSISEE